MNKENWEKEFNKEFGAIWNRQGNALLNHKIKSFIRQLLSEQKEEFKKMVERESNQARGDGLMGRRGEHYQLLKQVILKSIEKL